MSHYYVHAMVCDSCGVEITAKSKYLSPPIPEGWSRSDGSLARNLRVLDNRDRANEKYDDWCNICTITNQGSMNPSDFWPGSITWTHQTARSWYAIIPYEPGKQLTVRFYKRWDSKWYLWYYVPQREEHSLIELAVIAAACDEFIAAVDPQDIHLRETFDDRIVEEQFVRLYFGVKKGFKYKYRNGIKTWLIKKA